MNADDCEQVLASTGNANRTATDVESRTYDLTKEDSAILSTLNLSGAVEITRTATPIDLSGSPDEGLIDLTLESPADVTEETEHARSAGNFIQHARSAGNLIKVKREPRLTSNSMKPGNILGEMKLRRSLYGKKRSKKLPKVESLTTPSAVPFSSANFKLEKVKKKLFSDGEDDLPTLPMATQWIVHKKWETRKDAVTAVKLHSTHQGKRILQHHKGSSGDRVKLVCSKYGEKDPRHKCEYEAILRKTSLPVSHPWHLKEGTDPHRLHHGKNCLSVAKITFREAMVLASPVQQGRLSTSVKETTANIAHNNKITNEQVPTAVGKTS